MSVQNFIAVQTKVVDWLTNIISRDVLLVWLKTYIHKADQDKFTPLRHKYSVSLKNDHAENFFQKNRTNTLNSNLIKWELLPRQLCHFLLSEIWLWRSCYLTGARVSAGWGSSPGARMPTRIRHLLRPQAVPSWQARCENNIFPPSSPELDRSINLNHSLILAAAVTDVSYLIIVCQGGFDGWRAKLLWLNELLNH